MGWNIETRLLDAASTELAARTHEEPHDLVLGIPLKTAVARIVEENPTAVWVTMTLVITKV